LVYTTNYIKKKTHANEPLSQATVSFGIVHRLFLGE
jgi:hypothetical protein